MIIGIDYSFEKYFYCAENTCRIVMMKFVSYVFHLQSILKKFCFHFPIFKVDNIMENSIHQCSSIIIIINIVNALPAACKSSFCFTGIRKFIWLVFNSFIEDNLLQKNWCFMYYYFIVVIQQFLSWPDLKSR